MKSHGTAMFSQDEIDAVLKDAQEAVDTLAGDVDAMGDSTAVQATPAPAGPPPAQPAAAPRSPTLDRILKLKVPVRVRLANRSMLVSEIMNLGPGTILEFDRTVDQELDLMISNRQIGCGVAVKVNEHFGLRITYIGDVKERINSLGAI
ncbi:MAG: FliM/FliN family flagellar motor switch protein [Phycisphaerae bacterium]